MSTFRFTRTAIETRALAAALANPACGGYACFEGWVRDTNDGQRVRQLEYEAFEALAVREGERIVAEAAPAATSSTRSSIACRSGRRSTT